MLPELYYSLTNVRGFSDLNGKTYKEHIVVILENVLTDELKNAILNAKSDQEALALIPVDYTHNYQENY
tara:strand:+ start:11854 stop:12060 length:207 start_codon:yes stop_codon:yes gene_type:complete